MKSKKEIENIFFVTIAVIAIAVLISLIGTSYTGLIIYNNELNLDNNSNYTSENMNFSNSEIKLSYYIITENVTNEENYNYYLDEARYDNDDVTELVKENDDEFLIMNKNDKLKFKLEDKKFINNQTVALHILNGSEYVYLCKSNGYCVINGTNFIGGISADNEGFYNITIIGLEDEKKNLYLIANNISLDYIYMIEKNITSYLTEKIKYYENGYIEANLSINELDNFNYISANYILNNQSIKFYYINNDSWQEFFLGNISLSNSKIKITFNSDALATPIIYNITLSYNLICYENWTCSEWSNCTNENKTRACEDANACGTLIEKPNEIENCNETNPAPEIPSSSSGSGSSGGGGGRKITPEETRVLEQATQVPVKTSEETRILEKKVDLCTNGVQDNGETGIDCGGSCKKCASIITLLPYTNYLLFILLLLVIITLLNKCKVYIEK
ncbi:MAG: hypothetical protein KJ623_02370 [Nanoarchaeota archaeon]|nr:hypothetical protein [Nanoarchaeota archaeon]